MIQPHVQVAILSFLSVFFCLKLVRIFRFRDMDLTHGIVFRLCGKSASFFVQVKRCRATPVSCLNSAVNKNNKSQVGQGREETGVREGGA